MPGSRIVAVMHGYSTHDACAGDTRPYSEKSPEPGVAWTSGFFVAGDVYRNVHARAA